jgi:uncharacterized membrane protein
MVVFSVGVFVAGLWLGCAHLRVVSLLPPGFILVVVMKLLDSEGCGFVFAAGLGLVLLQLGYCAGLFFPQKPVRACRE